MIGARRIYARFRHHMWEERRQFMIALWSALGVTAAELARPWPLKTVFDFTLLGRTGEGLWSGPGAWMQTHTMAGLLVAGGAILLIALLHGALFQAQSLALATAAQRIVFAIRARLFAHLQTLSPGGDRQHRAGDLLSRLTQDTVLLREMLSVAFVTLGNSLLVFAGVAIVMLWMDVTLALAALSVLPAVAAIALLLSGRIRHAAARERRYEGRIAAAVHEALVGMRAIQAFTREDEEERRFEEQTQRSLDETLRARRLEIALAHTGRVMIAIGVALVLGLGAMRVRAGAMTPGDLLVFMSYVTAMYKPLTRSARLLGRLSRSVAAGERVAAAFDLEPEVIDRPGAIEASPGAGAIEFDGVTFGYEPGRPILTDLSFRLEGGELVALVGATGAGKSTILHLLMRYADPWQGRILLDGIEIDKLSLASLRRQISPALQEPLLFGLSIAENIAFSRPKATPRQIEDAARQAGAHDFITALEGGYDTPVGERGATLSGGQARRLAIARALLRKSPILALDEPASGLDAATEASIAGALRRLRGRRTILLIAHHFTSILAADRVLLLDAGRLLAAGRHAELYASSAHYRRLCDAQFGGRAAMAAVGQLSERIAADPEAAGPVAAGPAAADPVVADPVAAGPVAADPVAADPATRAMLASPSNNGAGDTDR